MKIATTFVVIFCSVVSLFATDPVSYQLEARDGRTVIVASTGKVIPWAAYSLGVDLSIDHWAEKHPPMVEAGIHLFQIAMWETKGHYFSNPLTPVEGSENFNLKESASWQTMVPKLLEIDPDARFIMRFSIVPDIAWRKTHLDQYSSLTVPGLMNDGRAMVPALASDLYLTTAEQTVRNAVNWCEKQEWRDRIVGYTIFVVGEGASDVALFDQVFDDSSATTNAFRVFLRDRYKNDEALRKAWNDTTVTLKSANVPDRTDWLKKKQELGVMHWPEPAKVQRELDYFRMQKGLYHRFWDKILTTLNDATAKRPVLKGCDNFKQHMLGWLHNADFNAEWAPDTMDSYNSIMLASGEMGIGGLLDHLGLDMIQTPGMYYNRAMGYAWEAEGLSDSLTLRGKVNFMEADMRTWVRKTWRGKMMKEGQQINDAGVFMTPAEMNAGFDRTLAWALSRNQMFYYAAVCGANWWFHDPSILEAIARQVSLIDDSSAQPWADSRDIICVVVDDESPFYEDFSSGFQHLALQRQLEEGRALCGVPYRIHLLSDLSRANMPDYRCYIFPNLFRVDGEIEALLRKKVLRNGNVAIFGPGTGITDGQTRSAAGASRLLGVEMELVEKTCARRVILQDHGHPMSRSMGTSTYGDSYAYGPLIVPKAQRLPADGSAR